MRKIKFRAWHKSSKEMLYADNSNIFQWLEQEKQPIEIMQFTGLLDKNGKEIFENDIVRSKSHEPPIYLVEFKEGGFCMTHPKLEHYPLDINHFYPSVGTDLEVIGNTYENPNLFEK